MRVVLSDLPAEFPDEEADGEDFAIENDNEQPLFFHPAAVPPVVDAVPGANEQIFANITLGIDRIVELIREAKESEDGFAEVEIDDEVELVTEGDVDVPLALAEQAGALLFLSVDD